MQTAVQTVNDTGQITLGRHMAGQQVTVEARGDSTWFIKIADTIPENERWFHEPEHQKQFKESMAWLGANQPSDANNAEIFAKLADHN